MLLKTVKCRLAVTNEQAASITATMLAFAAACNEIASYAKRQKMWHKFQLSAFYYHYIRVKYRLNANYVVRVFERVAQHPEAGEFKPSSITIDKALFRYIEPTEEASLSSMDGRLRLPMILGTYQRNRLQGWKRGAGTISYCKRTRRFFANLCIETPDVPADGTKPLGVDLGINRIATTSTGLVLSGREVNRKREKFSRVKASLQTKGTKGCKRTLKRLSGRERRFQQTINHQISRRLVTLAKETDSYLVLENLKGIMARTKNKGRNFRRSMGRWAFYQLRQFIAYKAQESGVRLVFVDPRNTSKSCSACGSLGIRHKHRFSCNSCGFVGDADIQAAINIAAKDALPIAP